MSDDNEEQTSLQAEEEAMQKPHESAEDYGARMKALYLRAEMLKNGTYYTTFNSLWDPKRASYSETDLSTFQRTAPPGFYSKNQKNKAQEYTLTHKEAYTRDTKVKDDGKSARTSHNDKTVKDFIWPCDVLGNGLRSPAQGEAAANRKRKRPSSAGEKGESISPATEEEMRSFESSYDFTAPTSAVQALQQLDEGAEAKLDDDDDDDEKHRTIYGDIAHLVPASPLYASLFFNVARWAYGIPPSDKDHEAVQKMIHGSRRPKNQNRTAGTGLKHSVSNKIRLSGQKTHFEESPNVLIVPVLDEDRLRCWNGEGYEALFLIGSKSKKNLYAIAAGVCFQTLGKVAELEEIEKARELLSKAVLSLSESLHQSHYHPPKGLTGKHREVIEALYSTMLALLKEKVALVPTDKDRAGEVRVRKISFVDQTELGHPAPDPLLLLVKAAMNWSKFHDFPLLAGGSIPDEEDEMSAAAEEAFLDWQAKARKERSAQEIIGSSITIF